MNAAASAWSHAGTCFRTCKRKGIGMFPLLAGSGLALLLATQVMQPPAGAMSPKALLDQVSRIPRGITAAEVRLRLGPPQHVARQILDRHAIEQWVYGEPPVLRVEFDRTKGQEPQVLTVRMAHPAKP